jgi:C-terminal processing protease CtpA/Prc
LKFAFFPQENRYAGPVAVLIDGMSASTSEVFSSGIQEIGRAVIVGERSAGAALPSFFQKLPTGAIFQFAIADFRTPKGVLIEGRGVIPDVEAKYDRASLLAGRDAQLEAAVKNIRNSREKKMTAPPLRPWYCTNSKPLAYARGTAPTQNGESYETNYADPGLRHAGGLHIGRAGEAEKRRAEDRCKSRRAADG